MEIVAYDIPVMLLGMAILLYLRVQTVHHTALGARLGPGALQLRKALGRDPALLGVAS